MCRVPFNCLPAAGGAAYLPPTFVSPRHLSTSAVDESVLDVDALGDADLPPLLPADGDDALLDSLLGVKAEGPGVGVAGAAAFGGPGALAAPACPAPLFPGYPYAVVTHVSQYETESSSRLSGMKARAGGAGGVGLSCAERR